MNYIPMVEDGKNSRSDIYSRLLSERIILLTGEVTDQMSEIVMSQLLYLEAENSEQDIKIYINSPGGSISAGLAIYDTMKLLKCDVQTICVGIAASMGSVLLAGGTKGKRYITENSEVLVHQPLIAGGVGGQQTDISIVADHMLNSRKRIEKLLSGFTGKSVDEIHTACERDNWLTAEEAVKFGLVDNILK